MYGWTPLTEVALLYLLSEGVKVSAIYVPELIGYSECNRTSVRTIDHFQLDCEVLVLHEPLADEFDSRMTVRKAACYPKAQLTENTVFHHNNGKVAFRHGREACVKSWLINST